MLKLQTCITKIRSIKAALLDCESILQRTLHPGAQRHHKRLAEALGSAWGRRAQSFWCSGARAQGTTDYSPACTETEEAVQYPCFSMPWDINLGTLAYPTTPWAVTPSLCLLLPAWGGGPLRNAPCSVCLGLYLACSWKEVSVQEPCDPILMLSTSYICAPGP